MKPDIATVPVVLVSLAVLGGCASSLSGLGGNESLSCKAPEGVICTSVSGVYVNATTIAAKSAPFATPTAPPLYSADAVALSNNKPASSGVMRSHARVLRLWIAPWEDSDGDLHAESTVHVLVDNGRWLIDHVRTTPGNRLDAVAPPSPVTGDRTKVPPDVPARSEPLPMPPGLPPALNPLPR